MSDLCARSGMCSKYVDSKALGNFSKTYHPPTYLFNERRQGV